MQSVGFFVVFCLAAALALPNVVLRDASTFDKLKVLVAKATSTPAGRITPKTSLANLTPLEQRRLAHSVEQKFGIKISDDDVRHYFSYTVQGIVNFIMETVHV